MFFLVFVYWLLTRTTDAINQPTPVTNVQSLLLTTPTGFLALDGQFIPVALGERTLQQGRALLGNGLLIGDFAAEGEIPRFWSALAA